MRAWALPAASPKKEDRVVINRTKLALGIVLLSCLHTSAQAETACEFDEAEMLALDQRDFDQDFNNGWRLVAKEKACRLVAADLIRTYIEANGEDGVIMTWHEGQMRAMAGQTAEAIRLFKAARKRSEDDQIGWNHYVDASVAFLQGDREQLERSRAKLSAMPRPDDFNPVDSFGNPVTIAWPVNLHVVDRFVNCFGESYDQAYNECKKPLAEKSDGK